MGILKIIMQHPDIITIGQDGMVNFDKHRREFELLAQLTLYQKAAANYAFAHHPPLVHWLGSTHVYTEDERWANTS